MADFLFVLATVLLLSIAGSLVRIIQGPTRADRMMGAQLMGTGGVAILLLLATAVGYRAIIDVALVLALLAAFAAVAFVKSVTRDGAGDPEES